MNGETKFNSAVKKFDHLTLPVLWIEAVRKIYYKQKIITVVTSLFFQAIEQLTPTIDFILKMAFNILPVVQKVIVCILAFMGCSGIAMCLLKYFFIYNMSGCTKKSIKYTAVFPYIKREIAKLEEKERTHRTDLLSFEHV